MSVILKIRLTAVTICRMEDNNDSSHTVMSNELCLAYISRLTPKCRMICRLTPKSCVMYAGLRLAKTFVCCCPDQLNKRLTDSKIESVRRKLCSVRAKSTFVVASSQSQRVAFMTRSARGGADRYVAGSARIIRGD